ncbi:MAG TPA: hypothetical protein VGL42_09570 [Opitutaceae bacterium]|jgi:uncharacterized lipoprotein YbaY
MKTFLLSVALAGLTLLSGCGSVEVDTTPAGDSNRVVTGTVEVGGGQLPPDAVVAVRVVDQVHHDYQDPNAALGVHSATSAVGLPPEVIGELKIPHATGPSVPFTLKFYCTDEQLSRGLVLEARVSYGGKVHYFNVESYALNSGNIGDPRRIYVNQVR